MYRKITKECFISLLFLFLVLPFAIADEEVHNITLSVRNSTYSLVAGANITLLQFNPQTQAETLVAANVTDANGTALLLNVNDTTTNLYYIDVRIYHNGTSNGNVTEMSIRGTPIPGIKFNVSLPLDANTSTVYTVPAIRVNVSAVNNTGELVNFSYVVLPSSLSSKIPIATRFAAGPSVEFYLPQQLNYSFFFFFQPNTTAAPTTPPSQFLFTNFTTYAQASTVYIQDNLTRTNITMTGYITVTQNTTVANWSLTRNLAQVFAITSATGGTAKGLIPPIGNISQQFSINATWFYNISLPASKAGIPLLISLHTANSNGTNPSTEYYAGYQNITAVTGNNLDLNFTLTKLTGTNAVEDVTGVNQSYFTVNLINGDSADAAVTSAFCEITVEAMAAGDRTNLEMSRMITAPDSAGRIFFPAQLGNFSNATVECFASRFAPLKVEANTSLNSTTMNFTAFTMQSISAGGTISDFSTTIKQSTIIRVLRSTSACNVFHPDLSACTLFTTNAIFDPIQIMIPFATVHTTLPDGSIIMLVNQQMTGSGFVAPRSRLSAGESASGGRDVFGFRFGAAVPKDIASQIFIGMRYNETIDDSGDVNFSMGILRDDTGRVVWNRSVDDAAARPAYFSDYNETLLRATGILASKTNKSEMVYVNTTNNTIWFSIPHFSESEPEVSEPAPASSSPTPGGFSSGGGGGGISKVEGVSFKQAVNGLTKGQGALISVGNGVLAVETITFTVAESVGKFEVTVSKEDHTTLPVEAQSFSGKSYLFLQISSSLPNVVLQKSSIEFKVRKSWLRENKVDKNNVALFRFASDWQKLTTVQRKEDDLFVYYQAPTPGFSYFLIGEKKVMGEGAVVEEEKQISVAEEEAIPPAPVEEAPAPKVTDIVMEEKVKGKRSPGGLLTIIIMVVVVVGIILYYLKKKTK